MKEYKVTSVKSIATEEEINEHLRTQVAEGWQLRDSVFMRFSDFRHSFVWERSLDKPDTLQNNKP